MVDSLICDQRDTQLSFHTLELGQLVTRKIRVLYFRFQGNDPALQVLPISTLRTNGRTCTFSRTASFCGCYCRDAALSVCQYIVMARRKAYFPKRKSSSRPAPMAHPKFWGLSQESLEVERRSDPFYATFSFS